ncbi:MAG: TetR/AcrR family transcriptional regulator [Hyphomicrobium sp.]
MGRRSSHTPEQLRELILEVSTKMISDEGIVAFSAREVARQIGYSPGTIYNVFHNLDELLLIIEGRLLDELAVDLDKVSSELSISDKVLALAHTYLNFTATKPKLWNLLFEHHLQDEANVPDWYRQKLDGLMSKFIDAILPLMPSSSGIEVKRSAHVLWAGLHGISSLATAHKLTNITSESAVMLVDHLVCTFLAGLKNSTDL